MCTGEVKDTKGLRDHMKKKGLTTAIEEVQDCLGCTVVFSKDGKRAWIGQPDITKKTR